jgi:sugar/nucleoside kinase (ribokinase family)
MNRQPEYTHPDYLFIGHITQDQINNNYRLGGTAAYGAIMAHRIGIRVGLVTSYAPGTPLDQLDGIEIHNQVSENTTTFNNSYTPSGRVQTLLNRAEDLDPGRIPENWRKARIIHLAPVCQEVQIRAGEGFPGNVLAYSLQGWLRGWDEKGLVHPTPLPDLKRGEKCPGTAFLSIEDLGFKREKLDPIRKIFPCTVFTTGNQAAELYQEGKMINIPPEPSLEVDPTGAGDIFAAAYMAYWLIKGKTPTEAARMANKLASISVTRPGIEGIPTREEILKTEKAYK